MKSATTIFYIYSREINSDLPLAQLFNHVLDRMDMRIFFAPSEFTHFDKEPQGDSRAETFYQMALTECYFHGVIDRLTNWQKDVERYINEFESNWRYYALADRQDLINEFGYDESDYDENGNLIEKPTDKMLQGCSLVTRLTDYNHNIFTTRPEHLRETYLLLLNNNIFSIDKFFKIQGKELPTYIKGEDGELVEQTYADKVVREALDNGNLEDMATSLYSIVDYVYKIASDLRKLKYNKDHKVFFAEMQNRISNAINLNVPLIPNPLNKGGVL